MGCGCQPGTGTWDAYISCAAVAPQPLAPDSVLVQYAAQAGARSSDFTLCYAVAVLKTRRSIYWKASPGDCGNTGIGLNQTTLNEIRVGSSLGAAAGVDPEPISAGILAGVASILGGFTAHHAAAVQNEETTNCSVSTTFNSTLEQLEQAVKTGALTPSQAATIVQQVQQQCDAVLAQLTKPCNFSCGARIALTALQRFMTDIGFNALVPQSFFQAISPAPPVVSPGAPGTYQVAPSNVPAPGLYPVPAGYPSASTTYSGASGPIIAPLNGNNQGVGVTTPVGNLGIPQNLPVGAIVMIGGIAYVASQA